jgi:uncharacterized coiled-coil protein SlyX
MENNLQIQKRIEYLETLLAPKKGVIKQYQEWIIQTELEIELLNNEISMLKSHLQVEAQK